MIKVDWKAKMTDPLEMDWESDFIRDLARPDVEVSRSWTLEGNVGGEFPYVGASGVGTTKITGHHTRSFIPELSINGWASKALCLKPGPQVGVGSDWANLSFETTVMQQGSPRPRGLSSFCQAVYRHARTTGNLAMGAEHIIVTMIGVPEIRSPDINEVELVHGSTFELTSDVENVEGNRRIAEQDEGG